MIIKSTKQKADALLYIQSQRKRFSWESMGSRFDKVRNFQTRNLQQERERETIFFGGEKSEI